MRLSNEIEFLKMKGYSATPKIVQMEVTRECPLSCPQCYKDLSGKKHMDIEILRVFLKQFSEIAPLALMINGGEPLLYPYIEKLLYYIKKSEINGYIYTSGVNIENFEPKIFESINIDISLNGSKEEINRLSRDGFTVSMDAIQFLHDNGIDYGITWVARHDNILDFPNMLMLAEENGANHIQIIESKIKNTGDAMKALSKDDYMQLVGYIHEYESKSHTVQIYRQQCFAFLRIAEKKRYADIFNGCMSGILSCAINLEGDFLPCMHLPYPEKAISLKDYWYNSSKLNKLRLSKYEEIEDCISS